MTAQWITILAVALPALVIVLWPLVGARSRSQQSSPRFDDRLERIRSDLVLLSAEGFTSLMPDRRPVGVVITERRFNRLNLAFSSQLVPGQVQVFAESR